MYTTRRLLLAQLLLMAAAALSLILATSLTVNPSDSWSRGFAWGMVMLLIGTSVMVWRQALQAERLRKALGVGLTHHMRTSLTHILMYNEMLLLGREGSDAQRQEWLEVVGREAQRLGSAVENLLFLIQDQNARSFPVRRRIDLGNVLEDVAAAHGLSDSGMTLDLDPPAGVLVEGDPSAMQQAIGNLLDAAVRAAEPGSRISASVASDGAKANVLVMFDTISCAAVASACWSRFDRQPLEGETSAGFGLELAVVRHIARLHGGKAGFVEWNGRTGYRMELPVAGA